VADRDAFSQLGQIQDTLDAKDGLTKDHKQRLIWMHLDSRMDLQRKSGLLLLSKMKAVDILSRLMSRDVNIEYVELFFQQ
jgi:hypothetical protein